ncbi:MAG TPA: hypothetical protein VMU94_14225 [Streptosporangiaceae bacterium]|nr:hypothetical protein [Streptosporangiaceae bacterium]
MPEIEYVMNADHAEAINGKLYLHGAGWTDLVQPMGPGGQPAIVHLGVGVSIMIGWNETNRRFPLTITITHEDGAELTRVEAQIEAGRPPGIPPGSSFRSVLAIAANIQFPKPGSYRLAAELDGETRTVVFRVHRQVQVDGPAALPPAIAS